MSEREDYLTYKCTVSITAMCRETGKETQAEYVTDYYAGRLGEELDTKILARKIMKRVLSEMHEKKV